jgi:glutaminyl-peptide cyclotransferase
VIPTPRAIRSSAVVAVLAFAACERSDGGIPDHPGFNGGRAWAFLGQQMAFGPRYAGDRGSERQLRWLMDELRFRADTVERQPFTFVGEEGRPVEAVNVLARFAPEIGERVLLVAHRDTRRRADGSPEALDRRFPVPGANVNASGVALLLELAELFRQQRPTIGVDLLFSDADEYTAERRLGGLRHFLATHPGYGARYAVVVQGVADREPRIALDAGSLQDAAEPTERLWALAGRLGHGTVLVGDTVPALEGHARLLREAGIPAVVVAEREYGPRHTHWQSVSDLQEHASRETLEAVGRAIAALLYGEAR